MNLHCRKPFDSPFQGYWSFGSFAILFRCSRVSQPMSPFGEEGFRMHRAITSNFGQYRVDLGRTSLSRRVRIYSSDRVPCATLCEVKSDVEAFRQASSVNLRGWKPNLAGDISGSYLRVAVVEPKGLVLPFDPNGSICAKFQSVFGCGCGACRRAPNRDHELGSYLMS
jgi:hypothetical protein